MSPRSRDRSSGNDGIAVQVLENTRIHDGAVHETKWRISRWNRRGLRCMNKACQHSIEEVEGRQYDPYDLKDGLIFVPKGRPLAIERYPFRVQKMKPGQPVPHLVVPHRYDPDGPNLYIGRQPVKHGTPTIGALGFLMRCPKCGDIMAGYSPDYDEGRLPDAVDVDGELSFFDPIFGNVLLNEGITEAWNCISNENTPVTFQNSTAQVGTGTSATAEGATDTDLLGSGVWKGMDGVYPTVSAQECQWKGVYATGDANQSWQEFSVRNDSTDDLNLNRKTADKGTKSSGTWTLEIDITLS